MSNLANRTTPVPTPTPELRNQFASHPVPVQSGTTLRRILFATLDRADQVAPEHAVVWEQFVRILEQNQSDPRSTARCAVLANMVALLVFDEAADYAATVELAAQIGQPRLARLQHRAAVALETEPDMPWTTAVVRRLVRWDLAARLGRDVADGVDGVDDDVATTCAVIAQNLVFEDIDPERATVQPITGVAQLHDLLDRGSIIEWRHQLGAIAASPWGPYADQLLEIGRASDRPSALAAIASSVEQCQEWCRDRERDQVAREIRHLVAVSGSSQREFAARIGTSPSRLSTYVRGTVTPSAAMLLRIQRASRMLQRQSGPTMLAPRR
ncbi:MAG TPA: helix-turn-helix transcriptional regulator [Nocardioides sp.]|nr:helix-turn-helix transcriptional regulator [Nocardioides sp.]